MIEKIRKQWLATLWAVVSLQIVLHLVSFILGLSEPLFLLVLIPGIAIMVGWDLLLYHCAYRKRGNKLLWFVQVMLILSMALNATKIIPSLIAGPIWLLVPSGRFVTRSTSICLSSMES